jgi:hypothetical protein
MRKVVALLILVFIALTLYCEALTTDSALLLVVDRIEEGFTVLIAGNEYAFKLPSSYLPEGSDEGSVLRMMIEVDAVSKQLKESSISTVFQALLSGSP